MKKTRKLLIVTLVILSITEQLNAQFKFGLKEGLNLGTQSEAGLLWRTNEIKLGHSIGLVGQYKLNKYFTMQTELNYQENGAIQKMDFKGKYQSIITEYNYYNVPMILKFDINDENLQLNNISLSLYSGVYYSYLSAAQLETKNTDQIIDLSKSSENNDYGSLLGLELSYNLKSTSELFIDLRYSMGFKEVNSLNQDYRNKIVSLSLGYKF